jgi:hypothetical protein
MAPRKFALGDQVRLAADPLWVTNTPQDVYTISRMLPAQPNVWQYRVKRVSDGQERAVSESRLLKVTPERPRPALSRWRARVKRSTRLLSWGCSGCRGGLFRLRQNPVKTKGRAENLILVGALRSNRHDEKPCPSLFGTYRARALRRSCAKGRARRESEIAGRKPTPAREGVCESPVDRRGKAGRDTGPTGAAGCLIFPALPVATGPLRGR